MSLETVVEDIREQARERAAAIREEGEDRAAAIVEEAERNAESTLEEAERDAERAIEREREQTLSSANLEAKQMRLEARRDVLDGLRDDVEDRLASLPDDRRRELTRELLEDAAAEFEDAGDVSVSGRAEDEDLIVALLEDYDGFSFAGPYDCLGGVVVEAEGSRLRVNNTFDSILESVWDEHLQEISARLFEQ